MSNISRVNPYRHLATGIAGKIKDSAHSTSATTKGVVEWLIGSPPQDSATLARISEARRREVFATDNDRVTLAAANTPLGLAVANLHLHDSESLIRSAEILGWRGEDSMLGSLRREPAILLRNDAGERLAITREHDNTLSIQTAGNSECIKRIVRQHTIDSTMAHLRNRGMTVTVAMLPNGEIQIEAQEPYHGQSDGRARIDARVNVEGAVSLDVDGVRGNRCEQIAAGLAIAVGGHLAEMERKAAYNQPASASVRCDVRA